MRSGYFSRILAASAWRFSAHVRTGEQGTQPHSGLARWQPWQPSRSGSRGPAGAAQGGIQPAGSAPARSDTEPSGAPSGGGQGPHRGCAPPAATAGAEPWPPRPSKHGSRPGMPSPAWQGKLAKRAGASSQAAAARASSARRGSQGTVLGCRAGFGEARGSCLACNEVAIGCLACRAGGQVPPLSDDAQLGTVPDLLAARVRSCANPLPEAAITGCSAWLHALLGSCQPVLDPVS